MALLRCVLDKFLGVGYRCFPLPLDVLTFAARCPHVLINASAPSSERWNYRARNGRLILPVTQLPRNHGVLLHGANLRHGANGFTSLPKEGMLRIFSSEKIRRLRPGLNPRTRVPEASLQTTRPPKPLIDYYGSKILKRVLLVMLLNSIDMIILGAQILPLQFHVFNNFGPRNTLPFFSFLSVWTTQTSDFSQFIVYIAIYTNNIFTHSLPQSTRISNIQHYK
jgi:hypothetical protein